MTVFVKTVNEKQAGLYLDTNAVRKDKLNYLDEAINYFNYISLTLHGMLDRYEKELQKYLNSLREAEIKENKQEIEFYKMLTEEKQEEIEEGKTLIAELPCSDDQNTFDLECCEYYCKYNGIKYTETEIHT